MFPMLKKLVTPIDGTSFRVKGIGERSLAELRRLFPITGKALVQVRDRRGRVALEVSARNTVTNFGYWAMMMNGMPFTGWNGNGGSASATDLLNSNSGFVLQINGAYTWYYDGANYHWANNPWAFWYASTDTQAPAAATNYLPGGTLQAYNANNSANGANVNVSNYGGSGVTVGTNNCTSATAAFSLQSPTAILVQTYLKANPTATTITIGSMGFTNACLMQSAVQSSSASFTAGSNYVDLDANEYNGSASPSSTANMSIASKLLPAGIQVGPGQSYTVDYVLSLG